MIALKRINKLGVNNQGGERSTQLPFQRQYCQIGEDTN